MKKKQKTIKYEAVSELGRLTFPTYNKLVSFLNPYWPKWLHKIEVFRIEDGFYTIGKYTENMRWPVKF